jgi:UDP-N-acetylglucosamine--N-acetylmuramyl-(pentapeptide) pyrophosphoryl-undecaprenol N-acetylglucosamine transferase
VRSHYSQAGVEGELVAFIDDMAAPSGERTSSSAAPAAMTIAELSAGGMASSW